MQREKTYSPLCFRPTPADISRLEIHGIHKAVANLTKDEVEESNVDVNVKIDSRGMLHTANAVLTYTTKPESASVKDKLKGLFGGSKDKDTADADGDSDKTAEELEQEKPKEKKIGLRFTEHVTGVKPMSAEERRNARKRYVADRFCPCQHRAYFLSFPDWRPSMPLKWLLLNEVTPSTTLKDTFIGSETC